MGNLEAVPGRAACGVGMLELAIAIIGILAVVVPFGIWWYKKRSDTRNALARTEAEELEAGMDRVDAATNPQRVLPPPQ